jgi:hypothetical protein
MDDPRLKFSRHLLFNLSRPEKSLLALAPLAEATGGLGKCKDPATGAPLFSDKADPAYQTLVAMAAAGRDYLARIKRFDMEGFQPRQAYVREMRRYGVLPSNWPAGSLVNPYELDRAYWKSLWHQP